MDEKQLEMMMQGMKAAGMSDEQIDSAIAMQKAAMEQYAGMVGGFDAAGIRKNMAEHMKNLGSALAAGALAAASGIDAARVQGMIEGDSYFEFSKRPSINRSYQWGVACGADLIHRRADIINDLTTGCDRDTCLIVLSGQWGINTAGEFSEMAESLKAGRHSKVYRALARGMPVEGFEGNMENLEKAELFFSRDGLISAGEVPNMLIWDLGRLVNISRFAFDAGLIGRDAALGHIRHVAEAVRMEYDSWRSVSIGYQFGRAVWGGIDLEYKELKEGMEQLLSEKDSPWVTLPFDMPFDFDAPA
jgi:hypothetical protein